jgi:hypothetical protein
MNLNPPLRKLALLAHLTLGVGWIGAVGAFVALAVIGVKSTDDGSVRASFVAMNLIARWVIVPFAIGALISGLVSALGTRWGLFRHYWVLIKLVLTVVALNVLVVQLAPIQALATLAADASATVVGLADAKRPLLHSVGGIAVLLIVQVLGIYKPKGMTRYGWRMEREEASSSPSASP